MLPQAIVQRYLQPPSKILAYSTHPGAVATGQTRQYNEAYGDAVGGAIQAAVRPLMRAPDEGAVRRARFCCSMKRLTPVIRPQLSVLWAATSAEARTGGYKNGEYFTDPAQVSRPVQRRAEKS